MVFFFSLNYDGFAHEEDIVLDPVEPLSVFPLVAIGRQHRLGASYDLILWEEFLRRLPPLPSSTARIKAARDGAPSHIGAPETTTGNRAAFRRLVDTRIAQRTTATPHLTVIRPA